MNSVENYYKLQCARLDEQRKVLLKQLRQLEEEITNIPLTPSATQAQQQTMKSSDVNGKRKTKSKMMGDQGQDDQEQQPQQPQQPQPQQPVQFQMPQIQFGGYSQLLQPMAGGAYQYVSPAPYPGGQPTIVIDTQQQQQQQAQGYDDYGSNEYNEGNQPSQTGGRRTTQRLPRQGKITAGGESVNPTARITIRKLG